MQVNPEPPIEYDSGNVFSPQKKCEVSPNDFW